MKNNAKTPCSTHMMRRCTGLCVYDVSMLTINYSLEPSFGRWM